MCGNIEHMKKVVHALLCCLLLLCACSKQDRPPLDVTGRAVYYWRTIFALDSTERHFLNSHHVERIYCRYFDVVLTPTDNGTLVPMPNATILFRDSLPEDIELIPTVFIMNDCMQHPDDSLASRIVRRIVQMNETNDIQRVHEIQIDCDYTARNRALYYDFLQQVRAEARHYGMNLSTTIRLHQLSMPAPPADYGVLMLYNTGDPNRIDQQTGLMARNPILDMRDVVPYLTHLGDYDLPLAAAYPTFIWQRNVHGAHIEHVADFEEVMRCKQAVEQERSELQKLIIIYHLDKENINRYTSNQYEEIYRH